MLRIGRKNARILLLSSVSALILFFLAGCGGSTPPPGMGAISGAVLDVNTADHQVNLPVIGATVSAGGQEAVTDKLGIYRTARGQDHGHDERRAIRTALDQRRRPGRPERGGRH